MIEPAGICWPPNAFTPSILGLESRPFRVEPPPFFCAMVDYLLQRDDVTGPSGADRHDLEFGEVLAMTAMLLVVLATAHLEDANLVVPALGNHGSLHACTSDPGRADRQFRAVADCENLIQHDFLAHVRSNLFYLNLFAGCNLVLLATGFYDRVHI